MKGRNQLRGNPDIPVFHHLGRKARAGFIVSTAGLLSGAGIVNLRNPFLILFITFRLDNDRLARPIAGRGCHDGGRRRSVGIPRCCCRMGHDTHQAYHGIRYTDVPIGVGQVIMVAIIVTA